MNAVLSPEMQQAVRFANAHGNKLVRHPGGFWAGPQFVGVRPWFGTTTIEALVRRGIASYTGWKETHGRKFPIEVTLSGLMRQFPGA